MRSCTARARILLPRAPLASLNPESTLNLIFFDLEPESLLKYITNLNIHNEKKKRRRCSKVLCPGTRVQLYRVMLGEALGTVLERHYHEQQRGERRGQPGTFQNG